jgi:predicted ATP-grasp superfamily ATP-dependent carboligase
MSGPDHYDILILDAAYKQSLTSARLLGRAGLRIALAESLAQIDSSSVVPAFSSRYCSRSLVLPNYENDAPAFAAAVIQFVRDHSPRVVLPSGDGSIGVLRPYRQQLAELGCVLALAPESALEIANDKARTLEVARSLGIAQPRCITIDSIDDLPAAVAEFGFPFVLKPTVSWTERAVGRNIPTDVINQDEARAATERILAAGAGVLAQEWVPGRREGVTLFIVDDEVVASCGHVALRTSPPLGGASVIRESVLAPPDILEPAVQLAKAAGLQGVCEVEFRRDRNNHPLLMEINARLAGTIDNAVQSGVNFPLMIWRWATGLEVEPVTTHRSGVRTRWLHGDLEWVRINWGRVGRPDSVAHSTAIWAFVSEFARSRHYDYFDGHDLKPFVAELRHSAKIIRKGLSRKRDEQKSRAQDAKEAFRV